MVIFITDILSQFNLGLACLYFSRCRWKNEYWFNLSGLEFDKKICFSRQFFLEMLLTFIQCYCDFLMLL